MRTLTWVAAAWLLCVHAAAAQVRELPTPALEGSIGPNLSVAPDGRVLLSWIDRLGDGRHALRFSVKQGDGWSAPRVIAEGADWFVNWADFPSIVALPDGSLAAHWLVKSAAATYAYDVQIARSTDGGTHWSAPIVPHRDGTPTEHGFVSLFPARDGRLAAAWLDGREGSAMTLRYAAVGPDGAMQDEALLDARVCDCCQTSAAVTAEGPLVVYRDRSGQEVRDIAAVGLRAGRWSEPRGLPADGWEIQGCPVNGPAVAASDGRVAVAWFTAANDAPRVRLAFSNDAGASFGAAVRVDDGNPLGRVDVALLDDGSAVVSWVESSPEGGSLRVRRIPADGEPGAAAIVLPAGAKLGNGFPQMARSGDTLVFAWTAGQVKTAVMAVPGSPAP